MMQTCIFANNTENYVHSNDVQTTNYQMYHNILSATIILVHTYISSFLFVSRDILPNANPNCKLLLLPLRFVSR